MSRRTQHPRLVDVAELAGVSMRTVSNVVNDFPHVSPGTRERVEAAIAQLGYRPNLGARHLAKGRTGLVALVVPRLEMPYFASLAQQMLERAEAAGIMVVVQQTHDSHEREVEALEGRFGQNIDGIVLSPTTITDDDLRRRRSTVPLVLLGDREWSTPAWSVAIDHVAASTAATAHLVGQGRRRVAIVGPDLHKRHTRWQGWRDALTAHGLSIEPSLQVESHGLSGDHGIDAGRRIAALPHPPDAVFCVTDWLALGVIRSLELAGLRVPDDVAVVGYDDIPYGRASNPTLTSIAPDRAEIADVALHTVLTEARGDATPRGFLAGWSLVVRESSGGAQRPRVT